jgi:hypothetical protein
MWNGERRVTERACRIVPLFLIAILLGGCVPQRSTDSDLAAPRSRDEWSALVSAVRVYERRIGFQPTRNFLTFAQEKDAFPFCGYVSRLYLPYSYEDPAIQWLDSVSEQECEALGHDADVSFGQTEAVGERDSPVTASMLAAPLDRLLYLVIHEDCHDQFELPYGIEEALCNVIAYNAMGGFSEEQFAALGRERRAIQRYARDGARQSHVTVAYYERLAALYVRHDRASISAPALLRERERIFRRAERELAWPQGTMNNVWLANTMTYSRHYPLAERVFTALGRDLLKTVVFFKAVDAMKPTAADVMKRHRLTADTTVEFVRAYEAAMVETIEKALAEVRKSQQYRDSPT